ncbi:hypothetical protein THRCLA_00356 [Thraustotheca clavata]|uniref:START domain-containing protein n=1 Tax=Thraustotheca clavata TaxID=74557 RepID=A0A1W0ABS4_9STRA|nr:hypothetical protein THRCLA_00356 [Thraustotheca clavata]
MKYKGVGIVHHNLTKVFHCSSRVDLPLVIDTIMTSAKLLGVDANENGEITSVDPAIVASENMDICHLRYKVGWPIWDREFVLLEKREKFTRAQEEGGDYWVIADRSIDADAVPVANGVVRGIAHQSGWIFEQVPGLPEHTKVTFLMQIDPKGMIPIWLANFINVEEPLVIAKIERFLNERKSEYDDVVTTRSDRLHTVTW